jgi:TPR repeat protein
LKCVCVRIWCFLAKYVKGAILKKLFVVLMLTFSVAAWAGDYEDGVAAYEKKDYATARIKFKAAAEQGNVLAQSRLGVMYMNAVGGTYNMPEAFKLFKLPAEQGDAQAQFYLGFLYSHLKPVNYAEALKWYKAAAAQGHPRAQYFLGKMYSEGEHVGRNYAEALKWYKAAAEQGDIESQYDLGEMYSEGNGVTQNYAEALRWFNLAAAQGYINARFRVRNLAPEVEKEKNRKAREEEEKAIVAKREEEEKAIVEKREIEEKDRIAKAISHLPQFRKSLKEGDETNCGPVIEVKNKLIKVAHPVADYGNEHWIRREQIFTPEFGCSFYNGQYAPPNY